MTACCSLMNELHYGQSVDLFANDLECIIISRFRVRCVFPFSIYKVLGD